MKITCKIEYSDGHEHNVSYEVEHNKVITADFEGEDLIELLGVALILKNTATQLAYRVYELDILRRFANETT